MKNPGRPPEAAAESLSSLLVRAGASEQPDPRLLERTLLVLGITASALPLIAPKSIALRSSAVGGGAQPGALGSLGWLKAFGIGSVIGLSTIIVAPRDVGREELTPASPGSFPLTRPSADAQANDRELATIALASDASSTATREARTLEHAASPVVRQPRIDARAATAESRPVAPTGPPQSATHENSAADEELQREIQIVDRASAAYQAHAPAKALKELRNFEAVIASPRLYPEVVYLRMEAEFALGNEAAAQTWARVILRLHSRGPHHERARQLLSRRLDLR